MSKVREASLTTRIVLRELLEDPTQWRHGYDISKRTSVASGSLYPILTRLLERGLLEAEWEQGEPTGRPRRRLYRLTPAGMDEGKRALATQDKPVKEVKTRKVAKVRPAGGVA